MRDHKIIGLTGISGSGKSTVSKIFAENGCAVIDADVIAREVLDKNSICQKLIQIYYGDDIIDSIGQINRKKLGKTVFSDKQKLALLNSITHPFIISEAFKHIKNYKNMGCKFIIFDAPQRFESKADVICDFIISVTAPYDVCFERIRKRDNLSNDEIKKRLDCQYSDEYFKDKCDYIIDNRSSFRQLKNEILKLLELLKME